jgi:CRISPR-associated protein Csd1
VLLQALTDYAERHLAEERKDAAWTTKNVHWQIKISRQGDFLCVVDHTAIFPLNAQKSQGPLLMRVARSPVNRNNGEHPLLGTDEISYVLGAGPWTGDRLADRTRAEKHHAAFVSLIGRAASDTGDPALASCFQFYAKLEEVEKARDAMRRARTGALVALDVDGPLVERDTVRRYWWQHYHDALSARVDGNWGRCMVSGKWGPIAHPQERIRGVSNLGGRASGVALVSFDQRAFWSYGWQQNQNCPISPDRALAYVMAFNDLLKQNNGRRKDIAGLGFLYWLTDPSTLDPLDLLDRADLEEVRKLLQYNPRGDPDANRFCMVAVSGHGGRLRIHYWVELELSEVNANLQDWHRQLRVEYPQYEGYEPPPIRLWQVLRALSRDGKPDHHIVLALLKRSIEGLPLGDAVLSRALTQLRRSAGDSANRTSAEKNANPMPLGRLRVSLGLIRMCINDLLRQKGEVRGTSEGLDPACNIPAYVCGRLMAEYEHLQRISNAYEFSSSAANRYFALASIHPAFAFAKLEILAQKHMRILRRKSPSSVDPIDLRLQSLRRLLTSLERHAPSGALSLENQGIFALGYYHQRVRWGTGTPIESQNENAGNVARNELGRQESR